MPPGEAISNSSFCNFTKLSNLKLLEKIAWFTDWLVKLSEVLFYEHIDNEQKLSKDSKVNMLDVVVT